MAEVLDYYSFSGLPRTSTWEEVRKKVRTRYEEFRKKANIKGPDSKEAQQRNFWANALEFFKDESSKKAYDAQLDAWLKSPTAHDAQARAKSAAEDFAQKSTGALELLQQAWRELERGNVAEAMLLAGKAVRLDPSSWEAYFALGVANFRSSDLDEAMSCLRSAARLNPKSADVAAGIGEVYERQERWKDAYEQYRRAAEIEPDVLAHQISMGLVCVKAGVPDEGIEILRACQAKDPNDPGLNWVLGLALSESARLGWSYVQEGHPRVPEGWYAMSREQALQAVAKLHEATTLRFDDPDLSKHLAELKSDVDSNVKRHFTGNWILLGLISVLAIFNPEAAAKVIIGLFAAAYYAVNLVPQYAINARVLAGDHALKRGFFDWLDNLTNPWVKLGVLSVLFVFLPVFVVYWGIRNWTGSNAPIGKIVGDIQSRHKPDGGSPSGSDLSDRAHVPSPNTSPESTGEAAPVSRDAGGDELTASAAKAFTPVPTQAKLSTGDAGIKAAVGGPLSAKTSTSFVNANKTMVAVGAGLVVLLIVFGALFFNKSKNEDRLRVELEQKAAQVRDAEQRQIAAEKEARQQADARRQERDRADRAEAAAAAARQQRKQPARMPANMPSNFLADFEKYKGMNDAKAVAMAMDSGGRGAWSWSHSAATPDQAVSSAMEACETHRRKSGISEACSIFAVGSDIRWGGMPAASPNIASVGDIFLQPRIRVGDRHTFETVDMLDSRLNNFVAREVVAISGSEVVMRFVNQKSSYERLLTYNRDLGLVRSRYGKGDGVDYSPAIKYIQVPGRIDDTWISRSTETNIKTGKTRAHVIRAKIDGKETVTVPAGTFEAFRIVINSEVEEDGKVTGGQDISWFSPQVGRSVKSELRSTDATGKAGHRVVQLVSYSLGQ